MKRMWYEDGPGESGNEMYPRLAVNAPDSTGRQVTLHIARGDLRPMTEGFRYLLAARVGEGFCQRPYLQHIGVSEGAVGIAVAMYLGYVDKNAGNDVKVPEGILPIGLEEAAAARLSN